MSDVQSPSPAFPTPPPAPKQKSSYVFTAGIVALLVLGGVGYYLYVLSNNSPAPVDEIKGLYTSIVLVEKGSKLADGYVDANGDLVADAPTDPAKLRKIEEIGFAFIPNADEERAAAEMAEWKDLMTAMEKATGKKVVYVPGLMSTQEQLAALREGKLHVTACNTGLVSMAVNTAGFVPLASPADAAGKFTYEMEILVPAASAPKAPADLKGKKIGLVTMSSNSGGKAPLALLKEKFNMVPGKDYSFAFTGDHMAAIKAAAEGKFDAVCVANDMFARAIASGVVKKDELKSIYTSSSFPPLCFGVAYDLPPDLAAKIKESLLNFKFEGTSVGKRYTPQGKTGFAPVDYKKDWQYVRDIDASLLKLLDTK